jgi:hypothetical protein
MEIRPRRARRAGDDAEADGRRAPRAGARPNRLWLLAHAAEKENKASRAA